MEKRRPTSAPMLAMARRAFLNGERIPAGSVPSAIQRSWERARGVGLNVWDQRIFNPVSRSDRLRIEESNQPMLDWCLPDLEKLLRSYGNGGWGFACADTTGLIVKSVCGTRPEFRDLGMILGTGRNVSETAIGTNAPGCALIEETAVIVQGDEHYLEEISPFDCVAVPLFDPQGSLFGVLDATRRHRPASEAVLDALRMAASGVENRRLVQEADALIVTLHYRHDLLDSPLAGLLSFGEEGRLQGANRVARGLLGLERDRKGLHFDELFDGAAHWFHRALAGQVSEGSLRSVGNIIFAARFSRKCAGTIFVPAGVAERSGLAGTGAARSKPTPVTRTSLTLDDPIARKALHVALRAYERDIPVLINGETGTGKDVLARTLHERSSRSGGPFVAINCASIPSGLIESEFFGYEDGAFTGAKRGGAAGKFEIAKGGTLFLDEIGDMPIDLQGRLLRVLQERSFCRLGSARPIPLDVRIVAATHRHLGELVAEGSFRQDLYFRVNGVRVGLPALRDREDLEDLINQILRHESPTSSRPNLSKEVRNALLHHPWPGNIRQLENALRIALVFCDGGDRIELSHLPEEILEGVPVAHRVGSSRRRGTEQSLRDAELDTVRAALARSGGNISEAARRLGVTRATLYRKLRRIADDEAGSGE